MNKTKYVIQESKNGCGAQATFVTDVSLAPGGKGLSVDKQFPQTEESLTDMRICYIAQQFFIRMWCSSGRDPMGMFAEVLAISPSWAWGIKLLAYKDAKPSSPRNMFDAQLITKTALKGSIEICWNVDDVKDLAPHLSHEQALDVLNEAKLRYDPEAGITSVTYQELADELYGACNE